MEITQDKSKPWLPWVSSWGSMLLSKITTIVFTKYCDVFYLDYSWQPFEEAILLTQHRVVVFVAAEAFMFGVVVNLQLQFSLCNLVLCCVEVFPNSALHSERIKSFINVISVQSWGVTLVTLSALFCWPPLVRALYLFGLLIRSFYQRTIGIVRNAGINCGKNWC